MAIEVWDIQVGVHTKMFYFTPFVIISPPPSLHIMEHFYLF